MTETEREIFWKLLIDLFLDRHARERQKRKEQAAMQASSNVQTPPDRAIGFSNGLSITPLAPYVE